MIQINAQTLELGILAGGANYQGDLASSEFKAMTQQTNFAIAGFLRYSINESFALKLQVLKTDLEADDTNSSYDFLVQRNLRFFSPLWDTSLRLEWYPFTANATVSTSCTTLIFLLGEVSFLLIHKQNI